MNSVSSNASPVRQWDGLVLRRAGTSSGEGISAPFIRRPIATVLLTAAVALAGIVAFLQLPTAPLPQVDFPTISVSATLPGASPHVMASAIAAPLARQLAPLAGPPRKPPAQLPRF